MYDLSIYKLNFTHHILSLIKFKTLMAKKTQQLSESEKNSGMNTKLKKAIIKTTEPNLISTETLTESK